MTTVLKIAVASLLAAGLLACGGGAKDKKGNLGDLKGQLEKLKKEKNKLDADIRDVEEAIAKADPDAARLTRTLVAVDTLRFTDFSHYIDLQGKVSGSGVGYVAPRGQGGVVRTIFVKVGDKVGVGQQVLKLEDAMQRQALQTAQQSTGQLKTRLTQAQTVYERVNNLWKQGIGAEINVINAKADVDALAAQLRAAESQVAQAAEALDMTNVRAGMSGVVEQVNVRTGEFFSGATQAGGQIVVVNNAALKVEVPAPDNYVARVKKGDKVLIAVPETGREPFVSTLSVVGVYIDPKTRSFNLEARLPNDPLLKANQTAIMKILDYEKKGVIVIPVNVLQSDDRGKYVYVLEQSGDKAVARKKLVTAGEVYNGKMEIRSGLSGGELLITEGYQSVFDGQAVTVSIPNQ